MFGAGEFNPRTRQGRRLLAHELTHVAQQSGGAANVVRRQGDFEDMPTREWPRAGIGQQRALQQRRQPELARMGHRLHRCDGLGCRPGRDHDGLEEPQRVPRQDAHRHQQARRTPTPAAALRSRLPASPASAARGAPRGNRGKGNEGFDFKQNITQVIQLHLYWRGAQLQVRHRLPAHPRRAGGGAAVPLHLPVNRNESAKAGTNPLAYSSMTQITGDSGFAMDTSIYSTFVQDDWQIAPAVKVLRRCPRPPLPLPGGAG